MPDKPKSQFQRKYPNHRIKRTEVGNQLNKSGACGQMAVHKLAS